MRFLPHGLGLRLVAVSAVIAAATALVVAIVVGKLSEDAIKDRLLRQAADVAAAVDAALSSGAGADDLGRVVSGAKARKAGGVWVLDREGHFVSSPDPRFRRFVEEGTPFGGVEIDLSVVHRPLKEGPVRVGGHRVPLKSVVDHYQSGFGVAQIADEPCVVAFQVLRDRGWIIGVDEPLATATGSSASLKRYILLTCGILGLSIILSTALSTSYVIKPYYRERLDLSARMEAANRNLKKLHEVSVGMQKSGSLENRIERILGAAKEVLGVDRIFIFLPNTEHTVLECKGAFGDHDEPPERLGVPLGPEGGVLAQAFLKRGTFQVLNAQDLPKELRLRPPYSELRALRSRSFVVLPMIVENNCVGVVAVDNQLSKRPITPDVIEGLELFTGQAAVAIENAKLYQQLKMYADELEITDHLTQLFTFFHLKKLLQGEIDRCRMTGERFSLAVVSIENFARYNELLGHKFGDDVLRRVAGAIRSTVRKRDVIGRCFGSTFAVIFSGTPVEEASRICDEMRSHIVTENYPGMEALPEGGIRLLDAVAEYPRGEALSAEDFFARVHGKSKKAA